MNLNESFLTALDSLMANKMRAVLTMLGVIIGVAAVIALLSLGNGVNESITGEISDIGTNLISVMPNRENSRGYPPLSTADVEALSNPLKAPAASQVAASAQGNQEVIVGGVSLNTTVTGVTANYFEVNNMTEYQSGDSLTQNDLDTNARVAVLGLGAAADLFPDEYPIGKSIKINGVSYEVVGVLDESGSAFNNTDENVYIPLTTAQKRLYPSRTQSGQKAVSLITVQAAGEDQVEAAQEQITEILRDQHDIAYADDDDFTILSQASLLETLDAITATMTAFLGSIAGISLVVGGIGIMNIMLVSVTERTREIGIRKAIGALKRDILVQFLIESVVLSLLGGLLGIALGWSVSSLAGMMLDVPTVVDANTVLLSSGFAAAIGLIFGIYPAWRAASLRPIEALRYE